ncbi:hypothetical protein D3C81_1559050 [compost metagenome]
MLQQALISKQRPTALQIIAAAGDLDQATTPIALSVAVGLRRIAQALGQVPGIVFLEILLVAQLSHMLQLPGLVADLRQEGGDAPGGTDITARHGVSEDQDERPCLSAGAWKNHE